VEDGRGLSRTAAEGTEPVRGDDGDDDGERGQAGDPAGASRG